VPLEAYGSLPNLEDVAISPDGSRVAFVRTDQDTRVIRIASLADGKVVSELRFGTQKLREVSWADNDRVLIETSTTYLPTDIVGKPDEWRQLHVYDLKHRSVRLIPDQTSLNDVMNVIDGDPTVRRVNGHTVLFVPSVVTSSSITLPGLVRVDLDTGLQRLLRTGKLTTQGWLVDEAGEIAAQSDYDGATQRWVLQIRRGDQMQEVAYKKEPIDVPELLGFGPTPDTLLVAWIENGDSVWRLLSLKDGTLGPPLAEHRKLSAPIQDPLSYRMIGGTYVDDAAHYVFFDPALQQHWDAIVRGFPGEHVDFISASADFQKIIVQVEGTRDGFAYGLVDLGTHQAKLLGDVYSAVRTPLAVQRVTYPAADGLKIPAYLTLPAGRPPKDLPVVVLVHGGPQDQDTAEFDWWSQALADQGYAVLRANYRGSSLDWEFLSAGFGQWGRKMQTDLSDGVRYLVREGIADPKRVCIVGASYGGYAALAGAALDPGVYRCAVSVAGISDIKRMLQWEALAHRLSPSVVRYWDRFMGVSGPRDPVVEAISPISHVEAISIPVLLIHGRDDTVVPYEQSSVMLDALRQAGKQAELVPLKHEDHWLSSSETRRQMLETSVAFLRAHNPVD